MFNLLFASGLYYDAVVVRTDAAGFNPTDAAHTDIPIWQTAWLLKKPAHIELMFNTVLWYDLLC